MGEIGSGSTPDPWKKMRSQRIPLERFREKARANGCFSPSSGERSSGQRKKAGREGRAFCKSYNSEWRLQEKCPHLEKPPPCSQESWPEEPLLGGWGERSPFRLCPKSLASFSFCHAFPWGGKAFYARPPGSPPNTHRGREGGTPSVHPPSSCSGSTAWDLVRRWDQVCPSLSSIQSH